jgi:hypothetical protein
VTHRSRAGITDPLDLGKVISDTDEYFRTKRMVDTFAALSTPELLDYVYFSTEPMEGAEKLQPLDFGKVSRSAPLSAVGERHAPREG